MSVHIGEVSSEVEMTAPAGGGGTAGSGAAGGAEGDKMQPSWQDRDRHRAVTDAAIAACARVDGRGFDV